MHDFLTPVDEVFLAYLAVACGVLAAGLLTLTILRLITRLDLSHAWRACIGWMLIIPAVFGSLYLGRYAAIAFFTLIGMGGFHEFSRASGLLAHRLMTGVVHAGIVLMGSACAIARFDLFLLIPALVLLAILFVPVLLNRIDGQMPAVALAMIGFVALGWCFGFVSLLANIANGHALILFLLFAVSVGDVAAYTFGKLFGRHALRSTISPRKTWEGAIGGFLVSLSLPWLLRFSLPGFETLDLLLTGLIIGVAAPMGDLAISALKRQFAIKDLGHSIPGHGGILDRIDSLLYAAPLFFILIRYRIGM